MPKMTNLEAIREARGMSRNALATAVDVSRTTIIKLEEGETEEPSYGLTMKIADALRTEHTALFLPAGSTVVLHSMASQEVTPA